MTDDGSTDELSRRNHAFYEAFEARDLDAMSDIWEHSDRVTLHPSRAGRVLRGWGAVAASWLACSRARSRSSSSSPTSTSRSTATSAWVTVDENILGDQTGSTVSVAEPVRPRRARGWRLVAHHGSAVAPRQ